MHTLIETGRLTSQEVIFLKKAGHIVFFSCHRTREDVLQDREDVFHVLGILISAI
jgi:hypothetical protein